MRRLKKIRRTNGSQLDLHQFHKFSLDFSSLIVTTSAFVKKGKVKDEAIKKIPETRDSNEPETNEGQIKEQDVQLT